MNVAHSGSSVIPGLRYRDAPAALQWLQDAFGFEERFVVPGEDGSIAHAQLTFGNGMIMLGSAQEGSEWDVRPPGEDGIPTQGIYVVVVDVDAHHARAAAAGARVFYGPRDTEYGSREYACRDLEGHPWSFGTYDPFVPHE